MRAITMVLLSTIFSLSVEAQNIFDSNKNPEQRQQDLLNFIKSDVDLYKHYSSGKKNLSAGKGLGYSSLGFIGVGGVLISIGANKSGGGFLDGLGEIVLGASSIFVGSILGTIGIVCHVKGSNKIRDVMDYADREAGIDYGGSLDFQTTNNGIGLVYSFN